MLLIGGVIGAQIGGRVGARLPAEQLRVLLALLVLAAGHSPRLTSWSATPAELYSLAPIGGGS